MNKLYKTIVCALCGHAVQVTEDEFVEHSDLSNKLVKLKKCVKCPHCHVNEFKPVQEDAK